MMFKHLEKILNEIPILIVPEIKVQRGNKILTAEGMAIQKQREDGSVMKYTALNYQCDDMVRGLLHESIHHYDVGASEWYIEQVENICWEKSQYRKLCQGKIVELCGRFNL